MIVRVVLPLPLETAFSYLVPEVLESDAQVGRRVVVEFGKRRLTGIISEQVADADPHEERSRLKPVLDVLDTTRAISDELLQLTRWIAHYYVCGWGEALKTALPSGIDRQEKVRIRPAGIPHGAWKEHATVQALFRYFAKHKHATLGGLRQAGIDVPMALVRRLERDRLVTSVRTVQNARVGIKHENVVRFVPAFRNAGSARDLTEQVRGPKQKAVITALAEANRNGEEAPAMQDLMRRTDASTTTIHSLVRKGILVISQREVIRTPGYASSSLDRAARHTLNEGQQQALDAIGAALEARTYETFLLHGVTGSGKTEVYLAALGLVLDRGQTGIVLVPEIALTPQTVQRFRQRFGDRIAVLHSSMSLGERYDAWRLLQSGHYTVAIGPRSAIFAPLSNIGIIIVDEEHEHTYKQSDKPPRYHARDVAVVRARMNKAVCVLGSATPSLESVQNARTGKYALLEMTERVPVPGHAAAPLPDIQVVDLVEERMHRRLEGTLSEPLRVAIGERLARKEQIILLRNRRGYAPVIECQACGAVPQCTDCSVSMTYHKVKHHLRCHYCGLAQRVPLVCFTCGSQDLRQVGAGTQRVEEELDACFPTARIARMDRDTTSTRNAHRDILEQFDRGETDILIGTQMVAKGLDFRRVTLVGVINADAGMWLPDFRAEERTFQLLMQVSGRAGRADLRGDVLLQTRQPGEELFWHVLEHDFAGFADRMLQDRKALGYPPFGRIVGVEFRGPEEKQVGDIAQRWKQLVVQQLPAAIQVLGPEPALIERVKKLYRHHLVLKAPKSFAGMQESLRQVTGEFGKPPRGYRIAIDVDSVGMI